MSNQLRKRTLSGHNHHNIAREKTMFVKVICYIYENDVTARA